MLMADKYLEQYERMRRSYDRFRETLGDKIPADYEDDVYAFFMHCYHLKDWLKNDSSVKVRMPNIATDVEQFTERSAALRLPDLCHSLKPLELKRSFLLTKALLSSDTSNIHNRLKLRVGQIPSTRLNYVWSMINAMALKGSGLSLLKLNGWVQRFS
jgi:hypothetical protein